MGALAITDHGNMFGVPQFVNAARKHGIKAIIGCECYVAPNMHDHKDKRRYHQLLLAKNRVGYENLIKLCSLGFTEGYYYKPRIDRAHIAKYAEGLIATTCCMGAEVPKAILEKGEKEAEEIFKAWLDIFGEDYYIELQRHGIEGQERYNQVLLKWAKKYGVKIIATNDVHYVKKEDSLAQDIMLCLQTGKKFDDPKRMRFVAEQFYMKSPQEMGALFHDLPEALANTKEITHKVEALSLTRDILMPNFQIPSSFNNQEEYLRHLTLQGARERYQPLTAEVQERIDYELKVLADMGYAGYMLIVQDMIKAAQQLGVVVGPGRGSAAGSVVVYALGITDVEPLRYQLLFERFLNPDRISMPDIDTDVDDEGRQKVIQYLAEKYGHNQVAQIVTFGTMGARSAIRDVARVLDLPLAMADRLAKLLPEKIGTTLAQGIAEVPLLAEYYQRTDSPEGKILKIAETLEHSPRHSGIHAAGVIISPGNLTDYIPAKLDKESNLLVTQYDGSVIESVGMLKMDLLGLKTLSIIRDTVKLVRKKDPEFDIKKIPLEDKKTFELYQSGHTIGIFQFESGGMRQWLSKLKPTHVEHLIAMNALYRPGPMEQIPHYIDRLHGKEKVAYPHPLLEQVLASTYGIPVYQEQIMQIAQKIAGYTAAQADILRRAMGKKKKEVMDEQKAVFIRGAKEKNNIEKEKAAEIFDLMAAFAEYGFNRSHSVAYTLVSFQTAYLKAHYPAAYMAAVLTHNQRNITKLAHFIEEAQRMGLNVLGPDINESDINCSNTNEQTIRFGLAAIKGVGEQAVESLVEHRKAHGKYKSLQEVVKAFVQPKDNKIPSKSSLENMALAGAFDEIAPHERKQYIYKEGESASFLEKLLRYEQKIYKRQNQAQKSLFAGLGEPMAEYGQAPQPPACTPYSDLERLKIEKDLLGCYLSGHPLAPYKMELEQLCNVHTQNIWEKKNKTIHLGGMVVAAKHAHNKHGRPFGKFTIEDPQGSVTLFLFGEVYNQYHTLIEVDAFLYLTGKVEERKFQKEVWDIRVERIEQLPEIGKKYTKAISLEIDAARLSREQIDRLDELLKKYEGRCMLLVDLYDRKEKKRLTMRAKEKHVRPDQGFFQGLKELRIDFRIHKGK